jgi:GNAT superfamily N-acetyltransferase
MFSVVSSNSQPHHLKQLRDWFVAEWGRVDPFESSKDGLVSPSPLLAIDGVQLLGGLAFTRYAVSGSEKIGLWINALFVAPAHRGMGIGSELIRGSKAEAARIKESELFAYTDVPELYQKLGWQVESHSAEGTVLKSGRWPYRNRNRTVSGVRSGGGLLRPDRELRRIRVRCRLADRLVRLHGG